MTIKVTTCAYCGSDNKYNKFTCKRCGAPLHKQLKEKQGSLRPEPLQGELIYSQSEFPIKYKIGGFVLSFGMCAVLILGIGLAVAVSPIFLLILLIAAGIGTFNLNFNDDLDPGNGF
jgi:uncharacterized membrane protein YvbJ